MDMLLKYHPDNTVRAWLTVHFATPEGWLRFSGRERYFTRIRAGHQLISRRVNAYGY
jgi:hypothetical protein